MTILKTIIIIVGMAFSTFGYLIYFKKDTILLTGLNPILRQAEKQNPMPKKLDLLNLYLV